MGMSTHVKGIRDFNSKTFKKMMDMKLLCEAQKFSYPKEVVDFFGEKLVEEDKYTIEEKMLEVEIEKTEAVEKFHGDMVEGFEVDITKLPKDVKIIRFYNSY